MSWSNEDPRHSIYKLKAIIVYDQVLNKVFQATVETKRGYSIWAPKHPRLELRTTVNNLHEQAGSPPWEVWHLHGTADKPVMFGQEPLHLKEFTEAIFETDYLVVIGTRILFPYPYIHTSSFDFANPYKTWYFCGDQTCLSYNGFGTYFKNPIDYPVQLKKVLDNLKTQQK